jgi:hypothetical protein
MPGTKGTLPMEIEPIPAHNVAYNRVEAKDLTPGQSLICWIDDAYSVEILSVPLSLKAPEPSSNEMPSSIVVALFHRSQPRPLDRSLVEMLRNASGQQSIEQMAWCWALDLCSPKVTDLQAPRWLLTAP